MILSFCDSPEVLSVMRIINFIVKFIKIIVPLLLMFFATLDYTKVISSGDNDALKNANKTAIRRGIAAILIFCVPTAINVIAKATSDSFEYSKCLSEATLEGIEIAYYNKMDYLVSISEESLSITDYNIANNYLDKIKNEEDVVEFENRLDDVKKKIDEIRKQQEEEENKKKVLADSIFMGDSRTNVLNNNSLLNSKERVIAKDGGNYYDFVSHISSAKNILNSNSAISYNIILNYGVNDLGNASKYCSKYNEFISSIGSNHKIFIVSVNPVRDSGSPYAKNSAIENFNNKMKTCSSNNNVYYCDVYNKASLNKWSSSYISGDSIHYNYNGYKFIYNSIKECISNN